ncbi:M48 family metalloprotease [Streptomyces sp. MBT33]|uniref:M48 family metalloprotease n=1 Tax=Streptomyces sp. MBT33 TaxID=1488363 RepID=UPI00190C53F5|nr:M48 family metalloprotease [Streptomyces sp. MBT33]MBK3642406.1 M48 family metalloprotease [Streptomyces sp. MBT33]
MSLFYERKDSEEPDKPGRPEAQEKPEEPGERESSFPIGRVYISARRRGVDVTALGHLVLHLPHGLASAVVVFTMSYIIGIVTGLEWWILFGCWALSGALAFNRPCERLLARWLLRLRYPAPEEEQKLRPVWREVTGRAGVDANAYQLWVQEKDAVNASAAAGHIVSVTSHSLSTLTPAQLGGVLAHELGHHTRGHAWASLLAYWYALPSRLTRLLVLRLAKRVQRPSGGAAILTAVVIAVVVLSLATTTYGLIFLPLATPYLVAAVSRQAELRADEHAASLGFAAPLMSVLRAEHDRREPRRDAPEGVALRLLDSHPDVYTRMHRLQTHLERRR